MSAMASKINSLAIVNSTVYSDADQRNHQSSASLAFVGGIHQSPVNSPHKGPVTRKCIHLVTSSYHPGIRCSWTHAWALDLVVMMGVNQVRELPNQIPLLFYLHGFCLQSKQWLPIGYHVSGVAATQIRDSYKLWEWLKNCQLSFQSKKSLDGKLRNEALVIPNRHTLGINSRRDIDHVHTLSLLSPAAWL